LLDHFWLGGPLTPVMVIAGFQVIIAICNYTFDTTPVEVKPEHGMELSSSVSIGKANDENNQEEEPLVQRQSSKHSV
jgi:hypothetical protein